MTLGGPYGDIAGSYEVELPGAYVDALLEDAQPAGVVLINRTPEPGEVGVPLDQLLELEVADLSALGVPDLTTLKVYVEGVLALDGGTFQPGWDGLDSGYLFVQADVLHVAIDYRGLFSSLHTLTVRVVCASSTPADAVALDATYTFTCADVSPPVLLAVAAVGLQRVQVTFDEPLYYGDGAGVADVLNPANWELERLGDGVTPIVSAVVAGVERVADNQYVLLTDIALTPGGFYRVYGTGFTDLAGNTITAPFNQLTFDGWAPTVPAGRAFDLYRMLPLVNRQEDVATLDLKRFAGCLQEVVGLQLFDIDRFLDILDPDLAPEPYLDAMLADLGNPFAFDLAETDKRRLVRVLVDMYKLKGTATGIIAVARFFLGLEATVSAFNFDADGLVLGESELGVDWALGPSGSFGRYSFEVSVPTNLTATQRAQLTDIVNYMKPAHTHFVKLNEPEIPLVIDHLELGLSELGTEWILH